MQAGTKDGVINNDSGNWRHKHTSLADAFLTMPPQAPSGLSNASSTTYNFSIRERYIQQILAVTLSSTGILYAVVTLYWFARMKRAFRHQYVIFATRCQFVASLGPLIASQTNHVADYERHVQIVVVLHPSCIKPCLRSYIGSILPSLRVFGICGNRSFRSV